MDYSSRKTKQAEEVKPKEFWRIPEWFPDLPADVQGKMRIFRDELVRFNDTLNLVSNKTLLMVDAIHFADCIIGNREIFKSVKPASVTDLSLGSGFPSLVMAVLNPSISFKVIEREPRRIEFLQQVAKQMGLSNFHCEQNTLDKLAPGSLDFVVMRAFTPITKAILALRRPVKKGGALYMFKGEEWASEIANIPSQLCSYWSPSLVAEYRLPIGEVKFSVVRLEKTAD